MNWTPHITYLPDKYLFNVYVDPGHGGLINGEYTTAPAKMYDHGDFVFYEGVYNRQVADKLISKLRAQIINYKVVAPSQHDEPLYKRVSRARNHALSFPMHKSLYLSLHGNAAGTESVSGIEVFTSPGLTDSDWMATIIFNNLKELGSRMRYDLSDNDPDKEARFYVLTKTPMPAVLVESGFFTNREEAKRMMSESYQDKLADLLVKSIKGIIDHENTI